MEELPCCPVCGSEKLNPFISCNDNFLTTEKFNIVKCNGCGLRFTNPRPTAIRLGRYYQSSEYISHSNSRKGIFNGIYRWVRKFTIAQKFILIGKFSSGNRIMDIGCATGEFLSYMKSKGWETIGIEPDENARRYAIDLHGLSVYEESHLDQLGDSSFEVITLWHVLEHVADLSGRMEALSRLLTPGGILVIAVPNADSHDALEYREFWAGYDVPRHLYHFTPNSMEKLLTRFHLKIVKTIPMKFDAYYVSLLSEKYRHGKMRWLQGLWNGCCSNWHARKDGNYSSLVFISKKV